MEYLIRIILGLALLVALGLGLQMKTGKQGRGGLADRKGLSILRTILVASLGPLLFWYIVWPETIPSEYTLNFPFWLRYVGISLFILGFLLRVWSQKILGEQWSADLSMKKGHKLIQEGPYGWFCHPIYSSYLLSAPGFLLSTENWIIGGLAISYATISMLRVHEEEKMLLEGFGKAYYIYKTATFIRRRNVVVFVSGIITLSINLGGVTQEILWILGV